MILDHIGLAVSDYEQSKEFYSKCLAPLGIKMVMEVQGQAGFGREGKLEFWFGTQEQAQRPMHIAFAVNNREQVKQFYEAAIVAGGKDNGAPGIRPDYMIEINKELLEEEDGPVLRHGLQELHQTQICLPRSEELYPDPKRLESRYSEFRNN